MDPNLPFRASSNNTILISKGLKVIIMASLGMYFLLDEDNKV